MKEQLEKLLQMVIQHKASDLHLTVGMPPVLRQHGILKAYGKHSLSHDDTESMAKVMIPDERWGYFLEKGEIDLSYNLLDGSRFRVNIFRQRSAVSLAIRAIPYSIPTLEDLCMPEVLKGIAAKPQGLVLVTGPTGSGKSTTLASVLDFINQNMRKHIITLEDPIEYLHRHKNCLIDQREIGTDTQSFANGLRAALRQDPDVILVGEMRDLETISTAITAAETGHLVLATLHTTDAPSTIDRIIDVFPAAQQPQVRFQLASVLVSIISQRLFPTVDRQGRRVATEVLINNSAVANLIRNEKIHQIPSIMQTSRALGMHTLEMSIGELLHHRIISREAAEPYLKDGSL
ncbi:type IV pilus twitching motility protein PilT [Ammoniphilus sp. CFH 90114]|uniref:type IV pilus twitching motility protein PilT n=1 Tax=Ammoniphilus sp. CFH 90114 TaxID=2493665 RepID=UPI00100E4A35|nr:type IV pilus twitching motility protein PilT [Ammoniphilus sp. CFH 90114]RXT14691.1 type IV pilus twitching motility protein PilT [Ammoniphilus sp. CFH 90114]